MRPKSSEYTYWGKTEACTRFNLSTSGVKRIPLQELRFSMERLEIDRDGSYGYLPLLQAIAGKCGVDPDCVVTTAGASAANFLSMAALIDDGDEVLIETPTFEPLVSTAIFLGAVVKRFPRTEESGYALDLASIRKIITSGTKLIVLTNLHNPSSALIPHATLRELGELVRDTGTRVLVDEVYLDAAYDDAPLSSHHLGPEFVATNSLTKVYGLSGLRCGWILARPPLANMMWRLNDLFAPHPAHPLEILSLAAFEQLNAIRETGRKIVQANRAIFNEFLRRQTAVTAPRINSGTTAFLRLSNECSKQFLGRLRTEWETSVMPGSFFGASDHHFRIGLGVDTELFREGIRRLGLALFSKNKM